ncbi:MAG TPA: Uma2 family endonuclease [Gemmataceae bacterium]|nr:Uma2 family endonuclease [Gemmataceae bacterium]
MASVVAPLSPTPWVPPFPVYRFTVEQYHRMIETGILTKDDRVELLEGWIVPKMPHSPPHDGTVWLVQTALLARLPPQWILRVQSAITTLDSEPEPDLVVARGPGLRYFTSHPQPDDIPLVVEVSDTSLQEDRDGKGRLYARAGIPVYWIVNLPESKVEVYTEPRAGKRPAYRQRTDYKTPKSLPLVLEGQQVARIGLRELLA